MYSHSKYMHSHVRLTCGTCFGMNTEGTFKKMVDALADVDVETRIDELQNHLVLVACGNILKEESPHTT